jgi:LPS export ABC transporter protein LptC
MKRRSNLFVLIVLISMILSCEVDLGDVNFQQELEATPDIIVENFIRQIYRDDILILELRALESRTFSNEAKQELDVIEFIEFDAEANVITEGRAESAVIFTNTDDVELSGSIYVFSEKEQAIVEGEYFYWSAAGKQISSLPSEIVRIVKESNEGTDIIEGKGFLADMRYRTVSFSEGVSGFLENESKVD